MDHFYVNRNEQDNGDHEVHKDSCSFLPALENRLYLGYFAHCREAVTKAKEFFRKSNGCYYCANACHSS